MCISYVCVCLQRTTKAFIVVVVVADCHHRSTIWNPMRPSERRKFQRIAKKHREFSFRLPLVTTMSQGGGVNCLLSDCRVTDDAKNFFLLFSKLAMPWMMSASKLREHK